MADYEIFISKFYKNILFILSNKQKFDEVIKENQQRGKHCPCCYKYQEVLKIEGWQEADCEKLTAIVEKALSLTETNYFIEAPNQILSGEHLRQLSSYQKKIKNELIMQLIAGLATETEFPVNALIKKIEEMQDFLSTNSALTQPKPFSIVNRNTLFAIGAVTILSAATVCLISKPSL